MGRAAVAVIAVAFLLATSGCGQQESPKATADWADSLCTSLNSWAVDMQSIIEQFVTPEDNTEATGSIIVALDSAETATKTLRDDVRNLGPPPLENGEQAKQLADQRVDAIKEHVDTAQKAAHKETDTLDALLQRDVKVSTQLKSASDEATSLLGKLGNVGNQIRSALDQSSACDDLRSNLSS